MSDYKCWKDGEDLSAAVKAALEKINSEVPVIAAAPKKVKIAVECSNGDQNVFEIGKANE